MSDSFESSISEPSPDLGAGAQPTSLFNHGENWVVGIGASAGGLEALNQFVSHLAKSFRGTIVIAQHLAPRAKSMLVELVSRQAFLPVLSALDQMQVMPGTIYVVPPNHDVEIRGDIVHLTPAGIETRPKPSVDAFFQSLARTFGARAVGIILSGTGTDGAEGIRAIKSSGGVTLAQDDRSAKYDGMPRAAVGTGSVDSILSPEQMAASLLQILNDHERRLESTTLDEKSLEQVFALIEERTSSNFRLYKPSTIRRRISKRMAELGIRSLNAYVERMREVHGEAQELTKELLISVTSFFRDRDVYEALAENLAALIHEKPAGSELRVWAAGCATGEEAYSLSMMIVDLLEKAHKFLHVKIFATDLDHDAILEARNGVFSTKDVESIPLSYRARFLFQRDALHWEIQKRVRDIVVFAKQDLAQQPPFVKLDLITCRNVLIYFENELQNRIMETFHYALRPSGILQLGKSENLGKAQGLFDAIDRQTKLYRKLNVPVARSSAMGSMPRATGAEVEAARARRAEAHPSLRELAVQQLLTTHELGAVIIDEETNILQILGDVTAYVGFHTSQADLRLLNLLPKGVGVEIPILLRKVIKEGGTQRSRVHARGKGESAGEYTIELRSLYDNGLGNIATGVRPLFTVSFSPIVRKEKSVKGTSTSADVTARIEELEHELSITREHLQTVIEELGSSNEELQSLNEEMSSTNEELQSSNEELETTNEELQSTNEELTTLNEEMNIKSAELRQLNANLENIQNSIGAPMVVIDRDLRILRYNRDALKVFPLSANDIGRDLTRVSSLFEIEGFTQLLRTAVSEGRALETICEGNSTVYQVRVLPAYDEAKVVTGAIAVFIDNTELLRAKQNLSISEERVRSIIESSPALISVKDASGKYLIANQALLNSYGLERDQVLGHTDRELLSEKVANQWREDDMEVFLKRAVSRREESLELLGRENHYLVSRFPLAESPTAAPYGVGTISFDISSQVEMSKQLTASETRYRTIAEDQAVFVCRHGPGPNLAITYINNFLALSLGGLAKPEKFEQVFPASERSMVLAEIQHISPENPVVQYELKFGRSGAADRWGRWIHRGIFNSAGLVTEYQAVGFDVTEYRNSTEQLLHKEAIFTGIFNNTTDFITVFRVGENGDLFLESLNRSAEQALGFAYTQLIGRKLEDFFNAERVVEVAAKYKDVVTSKQAGVFEEELQLPGGVKNFLTTIVPIPSAEGRIIRVAALSRDVSNYKNIERDLRRAKDDAEVANRTKSDFLASMSHELRTPLNVVLGLSQLLEGTKLDQEQGGYVKSIHRSGRVLLALIEDVLDISKIEAGKVRLENIAFDLREVVWEVADLFSAQAVEKGIELKMMISADAERAAVGDPGRVRQILVNFVSNALKFTDRGEIEIKLEIDTSKTSAADPAKNQWRNLTPTFLFSVRDTGIGIRTDDHDKIFQKFSQVQSGNARRYGGTGLGLVISKHLTDLMGGEIGFRSEQDRGSVFWFKIPLPVVNRAEKIPRLRVEPTTYPHVPQPATAGPVTAAQNVLAPAGNALRILAVDDNRESQNVIALLLRRMGHDTATASSGQEAIQIVTTRPIDLVLMDIQMPDMDGYETTGHIRRVDGPAARIPIIALTANALAGDAEKCLRAGMDAYLTKPVRIEALREAIAKWGSRSRGADQLANSAENLAARESSEQFDK